MMKWIRIWKTGSCERLELQTGQEGNGSHIRNSQQLLTQSITAGGTQLFCVQVVRRVPTMQIQRSIFCFHTMKWLYDSKANDRRPCVFSPPCRLWCENWEKMSLLTGLWCPQALQFYSINTWCIVILSSGMTRKSSIRTGMLLSLSVFLA